MSKSLFVILFLILTSNGKVSAQVDTLKKSWVYELDTVSTPGYSKKSEMVDTLSFFLIEGDNVYLAGEYDIKKFKKSGKVGRWKSTINEQGLEEASFYIFSRGLGRGSLTVKLKELPSDRIELHVVSAFATFDRKFIGHKVNLTAIDRSVFTKPTNPGKK